jgi:transcription factor IIIB subunit 2
MTSVSNGLKCPACGSRDIEFHESAGHAACVECGTLLEENTIVSSIEFQETGDRSHVIGQFVSANNANKPFNNLVARARGRYGFSRDSRDTTLQTARRAIQQVAAASSSGLRLPSHYVERAFR